MSAPGQYRSNHLITVKSRPDQTTNHQTNTEQSWNNRGITTNTDPNCLKNTPDQSNTSIIDGQNTRDQFTRPIPYIVGSAGPGRAGRCPPPSSRMLCCTSPSTSPLTPGTRVARWVPAYSTAALGVTAQAGHLRLCLIVKLFIGCRAREKVVEQGFGYFGRRVNHNNRRARRLPPSFTQT